MNILDICRIADVREQQGRSKLAQLVANHKHTNIFINREAFKFEENKHSRIAHSYPHCSAKVKIPEHYS